jgi:DNA-binding response OmpR family regulator
MFQGQDARLDREEPLNPVLNMTEPQSNNPKPKILVVDDDPTIRKLIGELLTREGFDVVVAKDGIDAMVLLSRDLPDLLVLDVMMPDFNGYDVCCHLKARPATKDLSIIILTSRDQELDPRLGSLMGIEYLHKSAPPKQLLTMIRRILGQNKTTNGQQGG